jgi:hypothetical protein
MRKENHHEFKHRINGIRRFHRGEQSVLVVITGIYAGANFKGYHFRALQSGAGMRQGEKGTAAERFITAMEKTAMDKPGPRTKPRPAAKVAPTSPPAPEAKTPSPAAGTGNSPVSGPTAPGNEAIQGAPAAQEEQATAAA